MDVYCSHLGHRKFVRGQINFRKKKFAETNAALHGMKLQGATMQLHCTRNFVNHLWASSNHALSGVINSTALVHRYWWDLHRALVVSWADYSLFESDHASGRWWETANFIVCTRFSLVTNRSAHGRYWWVGWTIVCCYPGVESKAFRPSEDLFLFWQYPHVPSSRGACYSRILNPF
jgi:hypothetical protein